MKIVIGILIVGAAGLLSYFLFSEYSFATHKIPSEAEITVIEIKKSRRKGSSQVEPKSYTIHVKYTPINGSLTETTFNMQKQPDFQVGSTIPIFYHARYPKHIKYRHTPTLAH
jgi:hypothetical protein